MIDFKGRVAVVTGAGNGLGRSHALLLAARGAKVVVNDLGSKVNGVGADRRAADQVVDEIRAAGGSAVAEYSSVATADGGQAIIQKAIDEFGRVDILINNAGIIRVQSFSKLDWDNLDRTLDVHLKGAFYVTKPAYQRMREQSYGRIVFTSSAAAVFGSLGVSPYGAAKGGLLGLMQVLKLEGARHGIKVNSIAPVAATRMGQEVQMEQQLGSAVEAQGPELTSPVVGYFCSEECAVTGELWSVAAGSIARIFTARTDGYFKHPIREGPVTTEDVAEHLDAIRNETSYSIPPSWPEEWRMVIDRLTLPAN